MRAKPELAVVTITKFTKKLFLEQLMYLLEDKINITGYSVEEGINNNIQADLILTTKLFNDEIDELIKEKNKVIIASRMLELPSLDKLINLPAGTNALLVCNSFTAACETKLFLKEIGINHLNLIPFDPEKKTPSVDLAIITGVDKNVPDNKKVIDIKRRIISISTIIEILIKFELLDNNSANIIIAKYFNRLIHSNKRLYETNKMFEVVINNISEGIIFFNPEREVKIINQAAKKIFKLKDKDIIGKKLKKNKFTQDLFSILAQDGEYLLNSIQNVGEDRKIVTSMIPVKEREEKLGTIAVCRDVTEIKLLEETLRNELKNKGHFAKYSFSDIIGESKTINIIKEKARNIAGSESTILIQGETGTGKELFAQAIHNYSERRNGPFVAINCATVPADLFESELFGYVEGAFTGAKKGGKPGVFEQAHKGTIFLDEIGDIPMNIQTKLLRVLQEREVMRIGATGIIPVDIRVIAATNKNLEQMVIDSKFREDLYYRINVLPLRIPALKNRREDIILLIENFLKQFGREDLSLSKQTISKLYNFEWPGNIRQLKNCIEYLTQVCKNQIRIKDLPGYLYNEKEAVKKDSKIQPKTLVQLGDIDEYVFILNELYLARQLNIAVGRGKIAANAKLENLNLSVQMVRSRLKKMEELGLVESGTTRQGTMITRKGIDFLNNI